MALFKSSNPALGKDTFINAARTGDASDTMTVSGAVNKTAFLGLVVFAFAMITWNMFMNTMDIAVVQPYMIGGFVGGFIIAIIIVFKKTMATYLATVYCAFEGLALGGLSAFMDASYPGIVLQAILITFSILFSLLLIYKLRMIKVTENFKMVVAAATGGIFIVYLISFVGSMFGFNLPYIHGNGTFGIIFSLVVIVIASLNLVMDFDFIEKGAEARAPKYMEWYGAFGLMVTIIWLYLEILRLLAKLASRR